MKIGKKLFSLLGTALLATAVDGILEVRRKYRQQVTQ